MIETYQVKAGVNKKKCYTFVDRGAKRVCLSFGFSNIEKYFAFRFIQGKGQYVRRVLFFSVHSIDCTSQSVSGYDQREGVSVAEDISRNFLERYARDTATSGYSYIKQERHYRAIGVLSPNREVCAGAASRFVVFGDLL